LRPIKVPLFSFLFVSFFFFFFFFFSERGRAFYVRFRLTLTVSISVCSFLRLSDRQINIPSDIATLFIVAPPFPLSLALLRIVPALPSTRGRNERRAASGESRIVSAQPPETMHLSFTSSESTLDERYLPPEMPTSARAIFGDFIKFEPNVASRFEHVNNTRIQ